MYKLPSKSGSFLKGSMLGINLKKINITSTIVEAIKGVSLSTHYCLIRTFRFGASVFLD
jgi:hypothetical protein